MKLHRLRVAFLRDSKIHVPDARDHAFVIPITKRAWQLQVCPQVATLLRACVDPETDMERVILKKRSPVLQELN